MSNKNRQNEKISAVNFANYAIFSVAVVVILWAVASTVKSNPETETFQESMTAIPSGNSSNSPQIKTASSPTPSLAPNLSTTNSGQITIPLGNSSAQKPSDIQGSSMTVTPSQLQGNNSNPQSSQQVTPEDLNSLNFK